MSEKETTKRTARTRAKPAAADAAKTMATDTAITTSQTQQNAAVTLINTQSNPETPSVVEGDQLELNASMADLGVANQEGSNEGHVSQGNDVTNGANGNALHILGAFTVRAKTDAGFWRSGVQFHRLTETLVLVVEHEIKDEIEFCTKAHEPERVVYLTREKAQRVHSEPNLVVADVELESLIDPASVIEQ